MVSNLTTRIDGYKDLQRSLKQMAPQTRLQMNRELRVIAKEVADDARSQVPVRSGAAAASIKPSVAQRGVGIVAGANKGADKSKAPYYAWLDFGGTLQPTGKRHNSQTREVIKGGRYIYPAVKRHFADIEARAIAAVESAKRLSGLSGFRGWIK